MKSRGIQARPGMSLCVVTMLVEVPILRKDLPKSDATDFRKSLESLWRGLNLNNVDIYSLHQAYSLRWQPVQAWKVPGANDFMLSKMISYLGKCDITCYQIYMISWFCKPMKSYVYDIICWNYDIVGSMTSYLRTYDIISITSYPKSYVYDCMCWNYDIIDIIYIMSYPFSFAQDIIGQHIWFYIWYHSW